MSNTIRGVQVSQADAPLQVIDLPRPRPGNGHVSVAVEACGICQSDADMVHGVFGDGPFPLTPATPAWPPGPARPRCSPVSCSSLPAATSPPFT